jgi:hypothetical protein
VAGQRIARILNGARQHGFAVRGDERTGRHLGDKPPTRTRLSEQVVGDVSGLGSTHYRILSAAAHGMLHGLTPLVGEATPLLGEESGVWVGRIGQDSRATALHLMAAPLSFSAMLRRLAHHYGWTASEAGDAIARCLQTWSAVADLAQESGHAE